VFLRMLWGPLTGHWPLANVAVMNAFTTHVTVQSRKRVGVKIRVVGEIQMPRGLEDRERARPHIEAGFPLMVVFRRSAPTSCWQLCFPS
jgi:hypothetical protein